MMKKSYIIRSSYPPPITNTIQAPKSVVDVTATIAALQLKVKIVGRFFTCSSGTLPEVKVPFDENIDLDYFSLHDVFYKEVKNGKLGCVDKYCFVKLWANSIQVNFEVAVIETDTQFSPWSDLTDRDAIIDGEKPKTLASPPELSAADITNALKAMKVEVKMECNFFTCNSSTLFMVKVLVNPTLAKELMKQKYVQNVLVKNGRYSCIDEFCCFAEVPGSMRLNFADSYINKYTFSIKWRGFGHQHFITDYFPVQSPFYSKNPVTRVPPPTSAQIRIRNFNLALDAIDVRASFEDDSFICTSSNLPKVKVPVDQEVAKELALIFKPRNARVKNGKLSCLANYCCFVQVWTKFIQVNFETNPITKSTPASDWSTKGMDDQILDGKKPKELASPSQVITTVTNTKAAREAMKVEAKIVGQSFPCTSGQLPTVNVPVDETLAKELIAKKDFTNDQVESGKLSCVSIYCCLVQVGATFITRNFADEKITKNTKPLEWVKKAPKKQTTAQASVPKSGYAMKFTPQSGLVVSVMTLTFFAFGF